MTPDCNIEHAAKILRAGGLVAFPTETVYGLGADAGNDTALLNIYRVKQRPAGHPLIVHLADAQLLHRYARDIPESAWTLAELFWPGPMTIVLKASKHTSRVLTGGQDTVGLRVPSHPVARSLLNAFDAGIAAPSANRFGRISPTQARHVTEELGSDVGLVLDGGSCEVGLESTIVDLSADQARILRPGAVTQAQIEAVIGELSPDTKGSLPRVPGTHTSHYAPLTPLSLVTRQSLQQQLEQSADSQSRIAVLSMTAQPLTFKGTAWKMMSNTCKEYGQQLFSTLRELDRLQCEKIIVESPPSTPEWEAVNDRLARAAG
ncbi:L-threonylcarbamoyladenylate synthase [Pseudohongiella spirulinae]|uniref:L-threonylcarbamoyladenylate synthase n=1 Tax=Pseudohongiella spirulinae TaxID=1249552 RepID=UPI000717A437|nr:L-threonylcarbamoyladenylate synthase [Pseudohongiella spirulinae]